jgi:hypothetical protein
MGHARRPVVTANPGFGKGYQRSRSLIIIRERGSFLMSRDQATIRLDNIAADIQAGQGTVGKLITDTTLVDQAQELLAKANQSMNQLQGAVTNVNLAAADLPGVTGALADEAKDLPGLVRQTQTSMRELERLIEALQKNWLVRKYVNKTNPPPAHPVAQATQKPEYEPLPQPSKISNAPRLQRP